MKNKKRYSDAQLVKVTKVVQKLLGTDLDGKFGPVTAQALSLLDLADVPTLSELHSEKKPTVVGNFLVKCLEDGSFDVSISSAGPSVNTAI
jgi:hypothetical protein